MIALGDIVARCLALFGVTKERVQAVAGKDCGCAKRQAAMNDWGYRWQYRMMFPFYWARSVPLYWLRMRWARAMQGPFGSRLIVATHYMRMAFRVLFYGD
jgi:hypothetical protein